MAPTAPWSSAASDVSGGVWRLRPSPYLVLTLVLLHCAAAGVAAVVDLPLPWRIALFLALAASLAHGLAIQGGWWSAQRIDSVRPKDGSTVMLYRGDGTEVLGRLRRDSVSSPWLVILRIELESGRTRSVLVPRDSTSPESFRRMRVWLRLLTVSDEEATKA